MDWLQEVAKIASAEGLPVAWPTPSGLLVQQAYRVPDVQVIKLAFGSVRLELNVHEDRTAQVLDKRRQSSGVAPNWVHSLDAAHLMRTINAASDLGLRSFCFIHDSYGTHAGNTQALATILREEFVRMYTEHDVLAEFAQAIRAQLPEGVELPPMPAHGNLDLSVVLDSPFFFA